MPLIQPPRIGDQVTATGAVRTVELVGAFDQLRLTLDVVDVLPASFPASFGEALEQTPPSLTPPPVHTCGRGCVACAAHDPRDRRDHGHLPADMCDACRAELTPQGYPDEDIVAAAGLEGAARGRDRVSWEDVARAALQELGRRDALDARRRAHEAATIVHGRQAAAAPLESHPGPVNRHPREWGGCAHGRPEGVRCSECSPT